MAKPKVSYIVKRYNDKLIKVYHNNASKLIKELKSIEGVDHITSFVDASDNILHIWIDPRYDVDELVIEITALLGSEVPDVFKQ